MNLNARERKIAIGVVVTAILMMLYYFAYEPYADARQQVLDGQKDVTEKLAHADSIFHREKLLRPVWADMQKGGLNVDPALAERQALDALNAWANDCGFNLITFKPERTMQEGTFQVVSISASGSGHMPQVARMLAAIETAGIPVRLSEVSVTPQKEGTDDLNVRFSLSALCQPPAGAAPAKTAATAGGGQSS